MNTLDVISLMHSLGAKSCISNLKRIGNFLTKIAPTQQGAVTEQSLALQLEALKRPLLCYACSSEYRLCCGEKTIVLPIKSLISQGFLSQRPLNGQSELKLLVLSLECKRLQFSR